MEGDKPLTPRQRQCLDRRQRHFTYKEIARQLGVSPATVAMHVRLARRKLQGSRGNSSPGHESEMQPMPDCGLADDARLYWSELLAMGAAGLMLWLTILALLVMITNGLVSGSQ